MEATHDPRTGWNILSMLPDPSYKSDPDLSPSEPSGSTKGHGSSR
jgi:hypothetical protein